MKDGYRGHVAIGVAVLLTAGSVWVAASGPGRGQQAAEPAGRQAQRCTVSGTVTAGGSARLPGVVISATGGDGIAPATTSSGLDGSYVLEVPGTGQYHVKAELSAFAPVVREVVVGADCKAKLDIGLTLASRAQGTQPVQATRLPSSAPASQQGGGRGTGFQPVAPVANGNNLQPVQPLTSEDPDTIAAHLSLPPGFSAETLSQSVTAYGSSGQTNEMMLFGGGREAMFAAGGMPGMPGVPGAPMLPGDAGGSTTFGQSGLPGAALGPGGGREGGPGGLGRGGMGPGAAGVGGGGGRGGMGPGGMGGGRGGLGPGGRGGEGPLAGRLGLGAQMANRPRGNASYTLGGSPFDAAPYSLTGTPTSKPDYLQQRFSASIGGPLKIPKVFDAGTRTSFFFNYAGNHSSNLYNQYSTVPTLAMRGGDFSALSTTILDPVTHQPFANNQIPLDRMDPAALALLAYIPTPNQEGSKQNFYYSTTNQTSSDDFNFRFIRSFGSTQRRPGARGGGAGRAGGGGGRGGAMGGGYNLNVGIHYQRANTTQADPFPTIHGTTERSGWDVPVGFTFPAWGGMLHSLRFDFNRSHSQTTNAFSYINDVAGNAGITGVSTDPFDWGLPSVSFSAFSALTDITPGLHTDQTLSLSDSIVKTKGRHAIRGGAEFRDLRVENRSSASSRGNYVFTGLYSGLGRAPGADFADFLLGLAQQASVQYGPGLEQFRSRSFAAYVQDDWRVRSNFTINAGVRYEYQSPYWEAQNRLVNLDVNADFTAASPVQAGAVGPYTGQFPTTVVNRDYDNFAPRVGIAWRPKPNNMIRGGYGINYSSVPYLSVVQRLGTQPPYSVTETNIGTITSPLVLTNAFGAAPTDTTTNNYGVDKNYQIGYVHIWNVDFQHDFGRTMSVGATYIGTKGSQLDIQRAPNRDPLGLRIEGVQPFIWESSGGRSLMNSLSLRISRRLAQGIAGNATYTLSKSMDDASTIGGGGAVVAQNDQDLGAEWGLSSFDQRHRFTGTLTWELPFGQNRKWLSSSGTAERLFGGWILNGTFTAASGNPFTARVVGNVADVARGVNGTLRADYTGLPIALDSPTVAEFFNTAAFTLPPAGRFGDSARNMIIGPGSNSLSAAVMKNFQFGGTRALTVRIQGNNILNQVQWAAIDTNINSPTFGQVTSVRPMRSLQLMLRVMY